MCVWGVGVEVIREGQRPRGALEYDLPQPLLFGLPETERQFFQEDLTLVFRGSSSPSQTLHPHLVQRSF